MGMVKQDDGWRLPDELWEQMEPLLPPRKPHPLLIRHGFVEQVFP